MRNAFLLLAFAAVACSTTVTQTPTPTPTPVVATTAVAELAPPPCNPGTPLVNAVVWMQTSAEYRASTLQTYATARRMLDAAIADPAWSAVPDVTPSASQPLAVILDADETAIDNSGFEARVIQQGKTFEQKTWDEWNAGTGVRAIPGATEFLAYAKSRNVTPFFITNREPQEEPATRANLQRLGFPLETSVDNVLLRGEREEWKTSDKTPRRKWVASSYRVLLLLGDDLNDFTAARDKSVADRDAIIANTANWWGQRWFMLPNPAYGSWERALTGGTGTPCEQYQKKFDALQPR